MCRRTCDASGLGLDLEALCHFGVRQAAMPRSQHTHLQRGICGLHSIRGLVLCESRQGRATDRYRTDSGWIQFI
jgi:hypothetical protein